MKAKTKVAVTFVCGFLAGAVVVGGLVVWRYTIMFRQFYLTQVAGQVYTVREIYAGRSKQLGEQIVQSLPQYVLAVDQLFGKREERLGIMWQTQRFYEENSIPVPENIAGIMQSLPPRPPSVCRLRKGETDANKSADSNLPAKE
ncbi:MAG: hypothetical protein ACYST6_15930 [Planctomycetota bacterium]|jgi:hypothetical protein